MRESTCYKKNYQYVYFQVENAVTQIPMNKTRKKLGALVFCVLKCDAFVGNATQTCIIYLTGAKINLMAWKNGKKSTKTSKI